nr:MAG TPA: NapC/NirT cytochrome c family, N-terminal region [Caudoviricetes sp.]
MTERCENLILWLLVALGLILILIGIGYCSSADALPRPENPSKVARCH